MRSYRFASSEVGLFKATFLCLLTVACLTGLLPAPAFCAEVTLTWDPNTEADLAGYRIYYGLSSGSYSEMVDVGNTTAYTLSNLSEGQIYYFAATAYDTEGLESEFSEEFRYTVPSPGADKLKMETGTVEVDQDWLRVDFQEAYSEPVVIASAASLEDYDPVAIRIRNVDAKGFEICLQEWEYLDDIHAQETVGYLVLEAGRHQLADGTQLEAGWFETDQIDSFVPVSFDTPFQTAPVVVTSISSFYGGDAVTGRIRGITASGFNYCMQEQEANSRSHVTEIINYIAWEASCGVVGDVAFEVAKTADEIVDQFEKIHFCQSHTDFPIFVADMQTSDGMNTANVRWRNLQPDSVEIQIDEEQSADEETAHISEVVGYMVFGRPSPGANPEVVVKADFNIARDDFTYVRDAFGEASKPGYDTGAWIASGGVTGGALEVTLGGIDYADVFDMSGGWQQDFVLSDGAEVKLSLSYKLTQTTGYESDEVSQVLVSVDDVLYGQGNDDYVAQIAGDGNGGSPQSTGWQSVELDLGRLPAGTHRLVIGGYNNKKTYNDESTEILIDDVQVMATAD